MYWYEHAAYVTTLVLMLISIGLLAGKVDSFQDQIDDIRKELVISQEERESLKKDVFRWERVNDTALHMLSEGGWEWSKQ